MPSSHRPLGHASPLSQPRDAATGQFGRIPPNSPTASLDLCPQQPFDRWDELAAWDEDDEHNEAVAALIAALHAAAPRFVGDAPSSDAGEGEICLSPSPWSQRTQWSRAIGALSRQLQLRPAIDLTAGAPVERSRLDDMLPWQRWVATWKLVGLTQGHAVDSEEQEGPIANLPVVLEIAPGLRLILDGHHRAITEVVAGSDGTFDHHTLRLAALVERGVVDADTAERLAAGPPLEAAPAS